MPTPPADEVRDLTVPGALRIFEGSGPLTFREVLAEAEDTGATYQIARVIPLGLHITATWPATGRTATAILDEQDVIRIVCETLRDRLEPPFPGGTPEPADEPARLHGKVTRRADGTVRRIDLDPAQPVILDLRGFQGTVRHRVTVVEWIHGRYVVGTVRQRKSTSGGGDYERGGDLTISQDEVKRDHPAFAAQVEALAASRP